MTCLVAFIKLGVIVNAASKPHMAEILQIRRLGPVDLEPHES